jgi:hypothetical protein
MIRWPIRIIFGIALYQMIKDGSASQEGSAFWFAGVIFLGTFLFGGGKNKEVQGKEKVEEKKEKEKKMGLFSKIAGAVIANNLSKQPTVYSTDSEVEILSVHRSGTGWECKFKKGKGSIKSVKFNTNTTSNSSGSLKMKWSH